MTTANPKFYIDIVIYFFFLEKLSHLECRVFPRGCHKIMDR